MPTLWGRATLQETITVTRMSCTISGQRQDSPFAELTYWQHMTDGNNAILHPKRESEIDRQQFEHEKAAHWMARY